MAQQDNKILALIGFNCTGDMGPYTFYRSSKGQLVFFPRAPALNPPTMTQRVIRQRFVTAGALWRGLTDANQADWLRATVLAKLRITGYNLWLYWCMTSDRGAIAYVERVSGLTLTLQPGG